MYIVGAANVGKSTLVNRLVSTAWSVAFHGDAPHLARHDALTARQRAKDAARLLREQQALEDPDSRVALDDINNAADLGVLSNRSKRRLREHMRAEARAAATAAAASAGGDNDGGRLQLDGSGSGSATDALQSLTSPFDDAIEFDLAAKSSEPVVVAVAAPPFVTASPLPGTTLRTVSVPFVGPTTLHDTPGVVLDEGKQALYETLAKAGGVVTIRKLMPLKRQKVS